MTLTQQERDKFVVWLDEEANSIKQVAEQMKKLNLPEVMFKKFATEVVACTIVADKLRSTESVTI